MQGNQANNLGENQAVEPKTSGEMIGSLILMVIIVQIGFCKCKTSDTFASRKSLWKFQKWRFQSRLGDKAHEIWLRENLSWHIMMRATKAGGSI